MRFIRLLLVLSLLACPSFGAITYHNSSSNPADAGTLGVGTVAVTPPASMTTGDLVTLSCISKKDTNTYAISQASGQTWNSTSKISTTGISGQLFWARFNGSWGADPSVAITGTLTGTTCVMHVFRPTTGTNTWAVDQALVELDFAAPSTPFTVTIIGQTAAQSSGVTLAMWTTDDDNTWGSLSGSGWVVTGSAQYRNIDGTDDSCTFAHFIHTAPGATGNVSKNQAPLGDSGTSYIITFYEQEAGATALKDMIGRGIIPVAR